MLDFSLFSRRSRRSASQKELHRAAAVTWESLEDRQLLSASVHPGLGPASQNHGGPGGSLNQGPSETIQFSQAPSAVQTGLDTLATTDGVTAPAATSAIHLGNVNGIEIYTYDTDTTGTDSRLTVDENGNAITAPTKTTTTFGAITNTAVTGEINAIATALDLTAPSSTTSVDVITATDGTAIYSLALSPASSDSDSTQEHNALISVDSNGNPVGHERVPLGVLSTVIQNGLTSNAPSGATALDSTALVDVNTLDGVTLYTAHYSSTGTQTTVTVNAAGTLTSLPSLVQTTFGDIPSAAQTELQALATADGYSGTIDSSLSVTETVEASGTIIYTINLPITSDSSTTDNDVTLTLSVDAMGNPTVPPLDGSGLGGGSRFAPPGDGGGNGGDGDGDDSGSNGTGNSDCNPGSGDDSGSTDTSTGTATSTGSGVSASIGSTVGSTTATSSTNQTPAAATSSASSMIDATSTTTPVLTRAQERAAAQAEAKATRLAKAQARKAAALAAKVAKAAAAAARKAARLALKSESSSD